MEPVGEWWAIYLLLIEMNNAIFKTESVKSNKYESV